MHATTKVWVTCNQKRFPLEARTDISLGASDRLSIAQCFTQAQYAFNVKVYADYVRTYYDQILSLGKIPLIVDCGANIGASVRWFHAQYPDSHIIAIEPSPDNLEILRLNVADSFATIYEAGISSRKGFAYLDTSYDPAMGCRVNNLATGPKVRMVSLHEILSDIPSTFVPFLIKMDIEGTEKELFRNTTNLDLFPVVIVEPHDWLFPGQLTSRNFFMWHVSQKRELLIRNENIISIKYDGVSNVS